MFLRSKPDTNAPKPDPVIVADDAANLLYFGGALVGDAAAQRHVWLQPQLADVGTPNAKRSASSCPTRE